MLQERLSGMVMRGGMNGRHSNLLYLDIADIVQSLRAIRSGAKKISYMKGVVAPPSC